MSNLREEFSPGPEFEPGSPVLHTGTITTKLPRRSTAQARIFFFFGLIDCLGSLVVIAPARRAGDPGSNPGPGEKNALYLGFAHDL